MRGIFRVLAMTLAMLMLAPPAATPAAAQARDVPDPPAVWTHAQTGVRFPADIGEFHRTSVTEYNQDGSDASVGYDLGRGGKKLAAVTFYVYPPFPIGGCDNQFADIKRSIQDSKGYQNVVERIGRKAVTSPSGRHPGTALLATYDFDAQFDENVQRVHSEAYLFCPAGAKWLVAYRATSPVGIDVSMDVERLFRAIAWPAMLDN